MYKKTLTVINEVGLHARPASVFVKKANEFSSKISVRNQTTGSDWVDGKSILSVLTLGVEQGHQIELMVEGEDEQDAFQALVDLVETDFLDADGND